MSKRSITVSASTEILPSGCAPLPSTSKLIVQITIAGGGGRALAKPRLERAVVPFETRRTEEKEVGVPR